jgi:hypothetical protein
MLDCAHHPAHVLALLQAFQSKRTAAETPALIECPEVARLWLLSQGAAEEDYGDALLRSLFGQVGCPKPPCCTREIPPSPPPHAGCQP